ncbi:MAG: hypothetical protein ABIH04_10430 [Planctomycetota bacterium]
MNSEKESHKEDIQPLETVTGTFSKLAPWTLAHRSLWPRLAGLTYIFLG